MPKEVKLGRQPKEVRKGKEVSSRTISPIAVVVILLTLSGITPISKIGKLVSSTSLVSISNKVIKIRLVFMEASTVVGGVECYI